MTPDPQPEQPSLVVVHGGEPSAEELAALVVALHAMAPSAPAAPESGGGWRDRRALLRRQLPHGPGQWVASARPIR